MKLKYTHKHTIRYTKEMSDKLDYYAEKMGLSKNQLMVNLLSCEIDELAVLDKLGVLRFGSGVRNLLEAYRSRGKQMQLDM